MEKNTHLYTLKEKIETDDPIFSDYQTFKGTKTPIVIDNGSYRCRAGWGGEASPRLDFPSIVGKFRGKQAPPDGRLTAVGNDLKQADFARMATRSPFEEKENIVFHFDSQESIFDHIFSHLGIDTNRIEHPILMTETFCNPNYCRKNMSELLFECYDIPSVCYGVDDMFSFYANRVHPFGDFGHQDTLIISSSLNSSHIIPVLANQLHSNKSKRTSLGGFACTDYTQKLVQIKYPYHRTSITFDKAQQLKENHCYVAPNYVEELHAFNTGETSNTLIEDSGKPRVIQLPFMATVAPVISEEEKQRKHQMRVEQGLRLKQFAEKRRKEKAVEKEEILLRLTELKALKDIDPVGFEEGLKEEELASEQALDKEIAKLTTEVQKMGSATDNNNNNNENNESAEQQAAANKRKTAEEEAFSQNPEEYIQNLKKRKQELEENREKRERVNSQTAGRRNTVGKQKRMRAITGIAFDEASDDADNFGMNDEDWNIYLQASADPHPEIEEEAAELLQIESLLAKFAGENESTTNGQDTTTNAAKTGVGLTEADYQLYLTVERIRVPEILFQPSLIGVDQMGLAEALFHVLGQFDKAQQEALCKQIFLTGGSTKFPLFDERIRREIQMLRPVDSLVNVYRASDPSLDAWRGASLWSVASHKQKKANFSSSCITRAAYRECGSDYLEEHYLSNQFINLKL